jgi:uncharacterized protein (TIGR01319 family)
VKTENPWLIINIDSDKTKAILVEKGDNRYFVKGKGESSTTVGSPDLDVMIGVKRAIDSLETSLGSKSLGWDDTEDRRILCSSSTSGGLHMMVAGLISMISTESAQRAALGAGALLLDVFSKNDVRQDYKIVERMRSLRPDIFLLAGGVDGGAVNQVLGMAGLVSSSDIDPRFGSIYKLPIIYAGNVELRDKIESVMNEEKYAIKHVDNIRPVIERENLGPAREGIYDAYMEHVIIHSPGYDRLVKMVEGKIMPSQAAIGKVLYAYATQRNINLVAVDVGSATTDVYSVFNGLFNRSLNADIGLRYGISNVMKLVGVEKILQWIPEERGERELRNIVGNMMILQPESLSGDEVSVQQAVAREAIKLALQSHKEIASRLKGISLKRSIADMFEQAIEDTYLDMMKAQVVVGRGEVFKSYSDDASSALLLMDALEPSGVTELLVDKSSILPQLGMLCDKNSEAALQILSDECLVRLGTCLAPSGTASRGDEVLRLSLTSSGGRETSEQAHFGELKLIRLDPNESAQVDLTPSRRFDLGRGRGKRLVQTLHGGELGLIIDARGRPLSGPRDKSDLVWWRANIVGGEINSASGGS